MATENMKLSEYSKEFLSETYTPDEVDAINNLLVYMSNINAFSGNLLGDSPGIKFEPHLNNN